MKSYLDDHAYWLLSLTFIVILLMANWFDAKIIKVLWLTLDAGTLVFPITFVLADIITELYGYQATRRTIRLGLMFSLFYIAYSQFILLLPCPEAIVHNESFDRIMTLNYRITLASLLCYFTSEIINASILSQLRNYLDSKYMGFRFLFSTFVASGFDSFLISFLAFSGTMSTIACFKLAMDMWLVKMFVEIIFLPLSTTIVTKLKETSRSSQEIAY